jgi:hypothetical protein
MEVVQVLSVDEKVEHVVTLSADLQTSLYPIKFGELEELGSLKGFEQITFVLSFRCAMVEGIKDPALK